MRFRSLLLVLALPAALSPAGIARADDADRAALLQGVHEIAAPGIPGPLAVFGPRAFPVVVGRSGRSAVEPVVAAARLGRGRVVVFGHTGYFDREALETADTGPMMRNAVRWAAGPDGGPLRVGVRGAPGLAAWLRQNGVEAETLDGANMTARLKDLRAVCCAPAALSDREREALAAWTRRGGGLIAADLGWGWLQLNPGRTIQQHAGNRLLGDVGLLWADGYLERTTPKGFRAGDALPPLCHADTALRAVVAHAGGRAERAPQEVAQAVWTVTRAARTLPTDDRLFLPTLRRLRKQRRTDMAALWQKPVTMEDPLARLLATLDVEEANALPPERVTAHPAAARFPGAVPADASRVTRVVEVDTAVPRWHSTGLYAAPGEKVTVEIASSAVGQGLRLRIGAHADTLWDLEKWDRAPEVTRTFALSAPRTVVASAFGGPVYVEVPEGCRLGTVAVTLGGVVEAPRYQRSVTNPAAWRETIRNRPAPWAELEGRRVILTVPSDVVRGLDDPESLLAFWDDVTDACADLAAMPRDRPAPERYVADRQISAGYMHSGYPIMTHLDVAGMVVDLPRLKKEGSWGHFHEMGHNHQNGDWTFEGTGEVTVNLFSMYCYEKVVGQPFDQGHPAIRDRAKREERARAHMAAGAPFEKWQADPFLALTMYIQMIEGFGWEPFRKVFADYRALPPADRPKDDAAKRDRWLTMFSRQVGRNLGPFFQAWGVPTSPAARAALADLPAWTPEGDAAQ